MFRENWKTGQIDRMDFDRVLSAKKYAELQGSAWQILHKHVYELVNEGSFSVLYNERMGRPNVPINQIITILTIKELYDWSFSELEEQLKWNVGVQYACGINLDENAVTIRILSNFIRSLSVYHSEHGVDLFAEEFHRLVIEQIGRFRISTRIARVDSTQLASNVCEYNRLQFLVEAVKRLYRILDKHDKQTVNELLSAYTVADSDHFVINLHGSDVAQEFQKIGLCYYTLHQMFAGKYQGNDVWQMFERVYSEQFKVSNSEEVINIEVLHKLASSCLRAIDDPESTLRSKNGENHQGYVGNILETAHPENEINLITTADISPNNVSDEQMLVEAFDNAKMALPELEELHFDGGYGGDGLDKKLTKHKVKGIQTGIKGVNPEVRMHVQKEGDSYLIKCPLQHTIIFDKTSSGYQAVFSKLLCGNCMHKERCPAKYRKRLDAYVYNMPDKDVAKRIRLSNIDTIPKKRRTLRCGVEATMRQFKCHTNGGKSRLRGLFRHQLWLK
ncbi:MAG: transposase, partial [Candidatus Cloacimonadaceae bacterium]|nr:transposase [Candidatus Cloacimonadaceae bacterium]